MALQHVEIARRDRVEAQSLVSREQRGDLRLALLGLERAGRVDEPPSGLEELCRVVEQTGLERGKVRDVFRRLDIGNVGVPADGPGGGAGRIEQHRVERFAGLPCRRVGVHRLSGKTEPRQILASIPGLTFAVMPHADRCCGSAGVYSLTQNAMSVQLLESKMREVRATGATVVATSNPGCMAQLEAGARRFGPKVRVVHVVELLDRAYRAQQQ